MGLLKDDTIEVFRQASRGIQADIRLLREIRNERCPLRYTPNRFGGPFTCYGSCRSEEGFKDCDKSCSLPVVEKTLTYQPYWEKAPWPRICFWWQPEHSPWFGVIPSMVYRHKPEKKEDDEHNCDTCSGQCHGGDEE